MEMLQKRGLSQENLLGTMRSKNAYRTFTYAIEKAMLTASLIGSEQYTLFAPTEPRKPGGTGFTHMVGDLVSIRSPRLGTLTNRVAHCDRIAPWTFGTGALMRNLAARGLLR